MDLYALNKLMWIADLEGLPNFLYKCHLNPIEMTSALFFMLQIILKLSLVIFFEEEVFKVKYSLHI